MFIPETLTVINFEENDKFPRFFLCACENNNQYGILPIIVGKKEYKIYEIINIDFIIQFICPLKNIIKENNIKNNTKITITKDIIDNINNNNKIIDINNIIIIGKYKSVIEMRIYKIENFDNNISPLIELNAYLSCKNMDENLNGMSFIIQSLKKGNLIIGNYNRETIELEF